MSALASLLEARAEDLLAEWVERLRLGIAPDGKTETELRDHVPTLLRELQQALRNGRIPERSDAAELHGRQRYRLGFDLSAVVREYGVLRNVILDAASADGAAVSLSDVRILGDFVSNAIAEGVIEYNAKRVEDERALVAKSFDAVRDREAHLLTTLASIGDAVISTDTRGNITFLNRVAEALTGWTREAARGLHHREVFRVLDESTRIAAESPVESVLRDGAFVDRSNHLLVRRDGTEVPVDDNAAPITVEGGDLRGVVLVFRDVSARRELFEAARAARDDAESERTKLESLFAQAPVAIGIHEGPEHTYTFANEAYRSLVGGREVVGKALFEALPEMRGQGFDALFDQVKASGESYVAEARAATLLRNGKPESAWFTFVFAPKRNASGQVDGVMQCAIDVTTQVKAHQKAEATTQRQSEFEQQLIGIVSHDLRNPLSVIAMSAALLERDESLSSRSLQFVVRIRNATERAVRMVGDLLDFTKARLGGGIPVLPQPSDLHRVVGSVLDEIEAAHPERRLNVVHEGDAHGDWDSDRLAQMVQNLVTNALKYSPEDTTVDVVTRASEDSVSLSVHNFGVPIPSDKLAILFEPFQRAVERSDKVDRSIGLGLYIVKKIVDAHHGSIDVRSAEVDGTTFTVTLPRPRVRDDASESTPRGSGAGP